MATESENASRGCEHGKSQFNRIEDPDPRTGLEKTAACLRHDGAIETVECRRYRLVGIGFSLRFVLRASMPDPRLNPGGQ